MRVLCAAGVLVLVVACGDDPTPAVDAGAADAADAVAPANGIEDGDESDIDCGGSRSPACLDGKSCALPQDCASAVCTGGVCQVPTPTDAVKNGDETGVDCGGPAPKKCATGIGCAKGADCVEGVCDASAKTCTAASDGDQVKNGAETGVDCGGPGTAKKCPTGQGCTATSDCDNVLCGAGKTCDPPSKGDGLKNGTETDVDCGGAAPTTADRCIPGKKCVADTDCAAPGATCGAAKVCVPAPSCRVHEGGDTCGAFELGDGTASHESCCASVALPASTIKVDKYEITAGRMREFIRAVNNNVQGWVNAHRDITQQIPTEYVKYLPTGLDTPTQSIRKCESNGTGCSTRNQQFGVYDHLGNTVFMEDRPCPNCGQGCWIGANQYENGHPTYWWPKAEQNREWGAAERVFSREDLDVKSLNCVTQPLLAAFCAWDGGRLPTQAELGGAGGAWGPTAQPWGNAPDYHDTRTTTVPNRQQYSFNTGSWLVPMIGAGNVRNMLAYTDNTTNFNPFDQSPSFYQARYVFPLPKRGVNVIPDTNDQAYAVAPPGRMRHDFRPVGTGANDGYFDIRGNLMEITADYTAGTDDADHNSWPRVLWVGASFEGHEDERGGQNKSIFTKYGKQGGRCVRAQ